MGGLGAEALAEEVDGTMVEMDASDWATLGASAEQVARIAGRGGRSGSSLVTRRPKAALWRGMRPYRPCGQLSQATAVT